MSAWECPFCGRLAVFESMQKKRDSFSISGDSKFGVLVFESFVTICPNPECKEFTYSTTVSTGKYEAGYYKPDNLIERWVNRPNGIY